MVGDGLGRPLEGARAVVTGCARGIGWAIAEAMAAAGADVAGLDVHDLSGIESAVAQRGRRVIMRQADVRSREEVMAVADEVAEAWGGLDVWVNNAAVILSRPFLELSERDWDQVIKTNLLGYVNGCRAAITHMTAGRGGAIVNVSSVTDIQPVANLACYITSKGAIVGLTKALALEYASVGIRVNALAPGAVDTELNAEVWTEEVRTNYKARIPVGRIAKPDDIAGAAVFLASESARYLTGVELLVDGGLVLNGNVGNRTGSS